MKASVKQWLIYTITSSLTGLVVVGLCFAALSIAEGAPTTPLEFGLILMMSGVFSVCFAMIPSAITATIMINRKTPKQKYGVQSIITGVVVTAVCALLYCVVDGVSLLGSWSAIGSSEFWSQYTPHLGIALMTGLCASTVAALVARKVCA